MLVNKNTELIIDIHRKERKVDLLKMQALFKEKVSLNKYFLNKVLNLS